MAIKAGENFGKKPIHVNFFLLDDPGLGGNYKSECPVCKDGLLLMTRDSNTGELLNRDSCTLCGQQFIFDDISLVKKVGGR